MELAYLFDPNKQFQDRNGVNNVAGFLRVYYEGTDDRATTYKNFIGTLNPADIPIDNDGRAVVIVEGEKTYRLEVYARNGNLLWTQHPLCPLVGGGGSFEQVQSNWDEEDPTSAAFIKNKPDIDNGRIHRLRPVSDEVIGETSHYDGWVLDLESPNDSAPGGYDRLTPQRLKQILDNGEFLVMEVFQTGDYIPLALQALIDVQNVNPLQIQVEFVRQYVYNNLLRFLRMAMYTPTGEESYIQMLGIGPNSSWYQDKEALATNGDGSDVTVDFTEAQTRTNIGTGEKLSVLFGKIKKWFSELKSLAFKDKADLTQDVNGILPIANGGTNASTAYDARTNLDVYSKGEVNTAIDTAVAAYISSMTTNVNQHDSNTDTSSFTFVNGHVYHLSLYFEFTALKINTSSSGTGFLVVYIGTSGNSHYSTLQVVTIVEGSIQPGSFRIPIDWKASGIVDSSDNKLHLAVLFNGTMYSLVAGVSVYQFDLMGTDFDGT